MKYWIFLVMFVFSISGVYAFINGVDLEDKIVSGVVSAPDIDFKKTVSFFNSGGNKRLEIVSFGEDLFFSTDRNFVDLEKDKLSSFEVLLGREGLNHGVYVGKIDLSYKESSLEIPVILGVEVGDVVDIDVDLSQNSLQVDKGEDLKVDVTLHNLKSVEDTMIVTYGFEDLQGKEILKEQRVIDVERELEIGDIISLPLGLEVGSYVLWYEIEHLGFSGVDFIIIEIVDFNFSPEDRRDYSVFIYLGAFILLVVSLIVLSYYWNRRVVSEAKDWRKRLGVLKRVKFSDAAKSLRKLNHQKNALERAFAGGYITKASYNEAIREINKIFSKLKKRL